MKRYLIALLATGLITDIACAGELPLQVASLEKASTYVGYKTDLLDKSLLNKTMQESIQALTWNDRYSQPAVASKKSSDNSPAKLGGKE